MAMSYRPKWEHRYKADPRIFADDARWLFLIITIGVAAVMWHQPLALTYRSDMAWSVGVWIVYLPVRLFIRRHQGTPHWLVWMDGFLMVINMSWWRWLGVAVPLLTIIIVWEAAWSLSFPEGFLIGVALGAGYLVVGLWPLAPLSYWVAGVLVVPFYPMMACLAYLVRRQLGVYEHWAGTDDLTGLRNRRQLRQHVQQGPDGPFWWVLIIDLDDFKWVNDTYGHLTGDLILRDIGHLLQRCFRAEDCIGRYGGEEFVVAMPGSTHENAVQERLDHLMQELRAIADQWPLAVTLSGGVARSWQVGEAWESVMNRADQALYVAKTQGKNQIHWDDVLVHSEVSPDASERVTRYDN